MAHPFCRKPVSCVLPDLRCQHIVLTIFPSSSCFKSGADDTSSSAIVTVKLYIAYQVDCSAQHPMQVPNCTKTNRPSAIPCHEETQDLEEEYLAVLSTSCIMT